MHMVCGYYLGVWKCRVRRRRNAEHPRKAVAAKSLGGCSRTSETQAKAHEELPGKAGVHHVVRLRGFRLQSDTKAGAQSLQPQTL